MRAGRPRSLKGEGDAGGTPTLLEGEYDTAGAGVVLGMGNRMPMISLRMKNHWLLAVTLLFLTFLFILPGTGWLLRDQFRALFRPIHGVTLAVARSNMVADTLKTGEDTQPETEALLAEAERHPEDYLMQVAAVERFCFTTPVTRLPEQIARFHHLMVHYPRRPALYGHLLRCLVEDGVRLHRDETSLLWRKSDMGNYNSENRSSPVLLAKFDEIAAEGERIDPNNAYFQMMRSVGLFEFGRDAEALDALERASLKSNWDDFSLEDKQAGLWLTEKTFGHKDFLDRFIVWMGQPLWDYSGIIGAAQVAAYKAVLLEQAGRYREGLAIRERLIRCGNLMRVHSTDFRGSKVGVVIIETAVMRPGGVPYVQYHQVRDNHYLTRVSEFVAGNQEYCAYLRHQGFVESAKWAERELQIAGGIRGLERDALARSPVGPVGVKPVAEWWATDLDQLANAVCVLWMVAVASLPWPRRMWARMLAAVLSLSVPGIYLWFWPWQANPANIFWMSGPWAGYNTPPVVWCWFLLPRGFSVQGFCIVMSLIVPLLLVLWLFLRAWRRRERVAESVFGGLQQVGPKVACVLLLLYGVSMLVTLQLDGKASREFDEMLPQEGAYMFQHIGETWPDPRHREETLQYGHRGGFG